MNEVLASVARWAPAAAHVLRVAVALDQLYVMWPPDVTTADARAAWLLGELLVCAERLVARGQLWCSGRGTAHRTAWQIACLLLRCHSVKGHPHYDRVEFFDMLVLDASDVETAAQSILQALPSAPTAAPSAPAAGIVQIPDGLARAATAAIGGFGDSAASQTRRLGAGSIRFDPAAAVEELADRVRRTDVRLAAPSRYPGFAASYRLHGVDAGCVVAVDTSGSMSDAEVNASNMILSGVHDLGVRCELWLFNTAVYQRLANATRMPQAVQRGGTKFLPLVRELATRNVEHVILISDLLARDAITVPQHTIVVRTKHGTH